MRRRDPAAPIPPAADATQVDIDPQKFSYSAALGRKGLLVVMSREAFGVSFVIDRASVVLGRQKDCEFVIDDPLLSRRHSLITADPKGDFFIEDLNSTNATFLNSRKLQKKSRLQYGDRIVLGNTILRFYLEEELGKK
jgi:pSer/pThr/pTyr-binding forkhead associated (FHA) protein